MTQGMKNLLRPTRRTVLKGTLGGAAILATPSIVSGASDRLIVNMLGGQIEKNMREHIVEPFEKKFGVSVEVDITPNGPASYARIRAAMGAPGFDVASALTQGDVVLGAKENLLEKIDPAKVPNYEKGFEFERNFLPPYAVARSYDYMTILYNHDRLETPSSWRDYWDPIPRYGDRVSGHLLAYRPGSFLSMGALIMGAIAGGGGPENMQPVWDFLKSQKDHHAALVTSSSEVSAMFENGNVWMTPYWQYRTVIDIARGLPYSPTPLEALIKTDSTIGLLDCSAVCAGADNKMLAWEFINFSNEEEVQRNFALGMNLSPARADVELPADYAANALISEELLSRLVWVDPELLGNKRREWTLAWQEVMGTQ